MSEELPEPLLNETDDLRNAVQALIVMNLQTTTTFYNILSALQAEDTEKRRAYIKKADDIVRVLQKSTVSLGELFFKTSDAS